MHDRLSWVWLLVAAACGSQAAKPAEPAAPCGALEGVRRELAAFQRDDLNSWDWTKGQPAERRREAAEAIVSELVAACTASHWSKDVIACVVSEAKSPASHGGLVSHGGPSTCMDDASSEQVTNALDDAQERVLMKRLGPRPRNALDDYGEKLMRLQQRRDSRVEPRVVIPQRYAGFAWFARDASPVFRMLASLSSGRPACIDTVAPTLDGYYQAQPLGGAPSLIAAFGALDRDQLEACFLEVAKRVLPGARLEREAALTRLVTDKTAGYLGWANDDTLYWSADRAVVVDAVAQKTTIAANAAVMAVVARVDHTRSVWFAIAADLTSTLIGVPSTGVRFATDQLGREAKDAATPRLPISIEFATPADARRALAATRRPRPALPAALAVQLAKLTPATSGRDLELDLAPVLAHPELYGELRIAVEKALDDGTAAPPPSAP